MNDAVTDRGWSRVTVHTARSSPVQSPLQAPNSLAASGVATRETLVPAGTAEEQLLVHVMPAGVVLTVPPPGPATVIESGYPNVAVTVLLPSVVTEQVGEDPEHAPPQERNTAPGSGFAVSVTIAEGSNNDAQVAPSPHDSRPVMSVTEPPAPGFAVSCAIRAVTRLVPGNRSRSRSVATPGSPGLCVHCQKVQPRPCQSFAGTVGDGTFQCASHRR